MLTVNMNRTVKSRTRRIPSSPVSPAAVDLALAIPSVAERGAAKASSPKAPVYADRSERALPAPLALLAPSEAEGSEANGREAKGSVAQDNPAEGPAPSPRALARRPAHRHPALREPQGSNLERAGPPDPACPEAAERGRHQRKCRVCSHPDRDAIEEAFIHWHSPTLIAQDYQISDDSLHRHAYATGLDAVRSRNLRCAPERILEKAQRVVPTADAIVRAARAYTRINHAGEWVEPPMHVIVSSGSAFPLAELRACLAGRRAAADHSSPCTERSERACPERREWVVTHHSLRSSNRGIRELENGSTR